MAPAKDDPPILVPPMVGKAVDVFLAACEQVGADARLDGFKWLKSKRHLQRSRDDVSHIVYFQTSHYNEPGRAAVVRVGVNVRSKTLLRWRQDNGRPGPSDDALAGCYLSYLAPEHSLKEWNAWGDSFALAVREIRDLVATVALPFFDAFRADPEPMLALPQDQIEYALLGHRAAAVFERLVQQNRLDLVASALARFPPERQEELRAAYDNQPTLRSQPDYRPSANSVAATIFDLGLGHVLGWP
jgi:hypothetical protein